jgi:hypothetical protein
MNANWRRGLALADLGALIVVLCLLVVVLAAGSQHSRRLARVGEDLAHLRQIGAGTGSHAADHSDAYWALTWRRNQTFSTPYPDLNGPFAEDSQAAQAQALSIIRARGNRTAAETPLVPNVYPYRSLSHVTLADYLDLPLPTRVFISSADSAMLGYAENPGAYTGTAWRLPYMSSFGRGTGFFDQSPVGFRIGPGPSTNTVVVPAGGAYEPRRVSEVAYPSQKVLVHDWLARHFGRPAYHSYATARLPVLMCDGSATVRSFAEANRGADPNRPSDPAPMQWYQAGVGDPANTEPASAQVHVGPSWTRNGVSGRDFGAPEVFW